VPPIVLLVVALGAARAPAATPSASSAPVETRKNDGAAAAGDEKKSDGAKQPTKESTKEPTKVSVGGSTKEPTKVSVGGPTKTDASKEGAAPEPASERSKEKAAASAVKAGGSSKAGAASKKAAGAAKTADGAAPGAGTEEASGPITPPIKLSALHEEMSRPAPRHDEHAATRAERERLEQLAAEINKAREGLRQDTARLEAMLAARDALPSPVASSGTPSEGGDGGEPAKKVPSPLDNLAKAIRGMKPEQAAPIISRVDRKLAADVLLRMPGADAGKVLGVCKPEVAAELAAEIASRAPRTGRAELKPHAELK
jgi:flagellar motility protein MotE (MotC chaperone)